MKLEVKTMPNKTTTIVEQLTTEKYETVKKKKNHKISILFK